MANNNLTYKLVVLGGGGVGKSALTIRMITKNYVPDYDPTIEDRYVKTVAIDEEPAILDILDTAGQEEFCSMRDFWIREGEGFLLVYNITNQNTLKEVQSLRENILRTKEIAPNATYNSVPIVLVGNKSDLIKERQIPFDTGAALAKEWGCGFYETSAKSSSNTDECFLELVRQVRLQQQKLGKLAKVTKKRLSLLNGPPCSIL